MKKLWFKQFACCKECGTTDRPHAARGLCRRCYALKVTDGTYVPVPRGGPNLGRANELAERGLGLSEIARMMGISRQAVHMLVRKNPTWGKPVTRTCVRCGQTFVGKRSLRLCSVCVTTERAVSKCPICGKRKSVKSVHCLPCNGVKKRKLGDRETMRQVRQLRRRGWTYKEIAGFFHCATITVWYAINDPDQTRRRKRNTR